MAQLIIFFVFFGILTFCLVLDQIRKNHPRLKKRQYDELLNMNKHAAMVKKKETYLSVFENDVRYNELADAFDQLYILSFRSVVSGMEQNSLTIKSTKSKPTSPSRAAAVGTIVGGPGIGYAASLKAAENKQSYNETMRNLNSATEEHIRSYVSADVCFSQIKSIIDTNSKTRADWQEEEEKIQREMSKKYVVR